MPDIKMAVKFFVETVKRNGNINKTQNKTNFSYAWFEGRAMGYFRREAGANSPAA
jgi:hypothetical protein